MVLKAASTRDIAFVHLLYGIYASPAPAVFVRDEPTVTLPHRPPTPPLSPGRDRIDKYEDSIDIILTSAKTPGSTGIVHLGTMDVEPHGLQIPVAVKLAFSSHEKEVLKREYQIYRHLQSKGVGGIPVCFGLFFHDERVEHSEGPHALIMSSAGKSLGRDRSGLSVSARFVALSLVASVPCN